LRDTKYFDVSHQKMTATTPTPTSTISRSSWPTQSGPQCITTSQMMQVFFEHSTDGHGYIIVIDGLDTDKTDPIQYQI
jgi:hypothetical protein